MRFLIGLLLGFGLGFAAAILFAPERPEHEERVWETPPEEEPEARARENHDVAAALRRAVRSLQSQAQEAWEEAIQAAEEAEKEMRARYQRIARRTGGSRE